MDWLSGLGDLGAIFGNVATGGLFGLIGSLLGVGAKYLQERQRQAWQEKVWAHETDMQRLQIEAGKAETEREIAVVTAKADSDQRVASYGLPMHDPNKVHTFVNDVRGLFRPALTVLLLLASVVTLYWLVSMLKGSLPATAFTPYFDEVQVASLMQYSVHSLFFATTTAVVWWFGDRAMTPPGWKK